MIRNAFHKVVQGSANRFKISAYDKKMALIEQTMNFQVKNQINAKKTRHKSLQGISLRVK